MRKVLHLMGSLTDQDVEWLTAHGQTRLVPRDTPVIHEGVPVEALFILLEGKLSVRQAGLAGREVATLYPGEVLGEISFVDARPPSASVVSLHESHLFEVSKDVLGRKLARDDAFAARFYRALAVFLADRLRTTTAHLGYGKWEERSNADEIDDAVFDGISLAARRFDDMLKRLRIN
jgi:CRP/FNR family transcriptional regulator, cyclic AMP receptor protein